MPPPKFVSVVGPDRVEFPLRLGRGQNDREHWRAKARRVKAEREAAAWALANAVPFKAPCRIRLTRVAPSNGLDDDNLVGSLKAVRDQVASWVGVDDGNGAVRYEYAQARGPWGVIVERVATVDSVEAALRAVAVAKG